MRSSIQGSLDEVILRRGHPHDGRAALTCDRGNRVMYLRVAQVSMFAIYEHELREEFSTVGITGKEGKTDIETTGGSHSGDVSAGQHQPGACR